MRLLNGILILVTINSLSALRAQTVFTGELTGSAIDSGGGIIVGARVELVSESRGQKNLTVTGVTGEFRFSLLHPGEYTLSVSFPGLESVSQHATVELGQSSNLHIQLGLQERRESVTVTAQSTLAQTNSANLASTFTQQDLDLLPDPGGDVTAYAFLSPGVTLSTAGGMGNFSVFGIPAISNLFTVNGADQMDPYGNQNLGGASGLTLGSNELQEAAVITNGYTGQYGRLAGANINYLTKSGGNAFHGNALWSYNGRALNANDWFNNASGTQRPFSVSNSWADSLGGPILKDRLFFYVDNEGMRYVLPAAATVYTPTPDFASFVLTNLKAINPAAVPLYTTAFKLYAGAPEAAHAVPVTKVGDQRLGCDDLVDPVFGVSQPCAQTFRSTSNSLNSEWLLATRADYNPTAADRLYFRWKTDKGTAASVDPINSVFNIESPFPSYGGQLGYTKVIDARSVNALVLYAGYYSNIPGPANLQAALRTFPTTFAFTNGWANLGGQDFLFPQGIKARQWQLVDDYSLVLGRHALKLGLNIRKSFESTYFYGQLTSGSLTFTSMTDFVAGSLSKGSTYAQALGTVGAEDLTFYNAGLYGQDEWRIRPNLTVTLSLRADRNSNTTCAGGCFTEFARQSFSVIAHSAAIPFNQSIKRGLKEAFGSVDAVVLQPRLGIAYVLAKSTVLRGGLGVFTDQNSALLSDRFITNPPAEATFTTHSGLVATGDPNSIFAVVANSAKALQQGFANGSTLVQLQAQVPLGYAPPMFFASSQRVHAPRYNEWNVELQRAFGDRYLLSVNYVGNHGSDELIQNLFGNAFSKSGYAGLPVTAPDPRFGEILETNNQGWSNYNGLVSSFRWRRSPFLSGQFSYTWGHGLDICSNNCMPEPFNSLTAASLRFQFSPTGPAALNYGNSDYDVRHSFNAHYVLTPPEPRSGGRFENAVLGGWTAAGTFFFHTSYPFTIVDPNVAGQFGNLTGKLRQPVIADFLGSSFASCTAVGPTCYSASQFATPASQHDFGNIPRNSFRGPGYFDTDLNVSKTITIRERYSFALGASFLNMLNHPNFDLPVNAVTNVAFGRILSTVSAPTSAYGLFAGSTVSGRVVQTQIKFSF
jgi:Carboxypeptidase regulatory-like domain